MKKAFDYLDQHKVPYEFHDYKKLGISPEKLEEWASQAGWEKLLNRQGTTWRSLDDTVRESITTEKKAIGLMQEKTSIIKRPVIEQGNKIITIGFDRQQYDAVRWKRD